MTALGGQFLFSFASTAHATPYPMVKASRRWRLHHHVLARPTGVFGPADDQNPELGRDDVQPFGPIFTDDIQPTMSAGADPVLDVDQHLEARQMAGQRA